MTREDVIIDFYRALRDSLVKDVRYVSKEGNTVVYFKDNYKITVSFRVKLEDAPKGKQEVYMP